MRKFTATLIVVTAAFAFGCSRSENKTEAAAATPAAESAPANEPVSAAPSAAAEPAKPYTGVDYDCAGGGSFNAKLDRGNMVVTVDGKTATLSPAENNGATYAGEGLTYIPNGNEATLIKEGQAPQNCKAKS